MRGDDSSRGQDVSRGGGARRAHAPGIERNGRDFSGASVRGATSVPKLTDAPRLQLLFVAQGPEGRSMHLQTDHILNSDKID